MESYTIRKKNGKLEGPYGFRVIRAFIVSGKYKEDDAVVTPNGDIPLGKHPQLGDFWRPPDPAQPASKTPAPAARKAAPAAPPKPKGRVVMHQGKLLPPGANPDFAGSLAKHTLIFLMYRFVLAKVTGRLHLRSGRETVDIFLEHGQPSYVVSNTPQTLLGEMLVRDNYLSREEQAGLLAKANATRRPLGQILLDDRILSPTQMQEVLTQQFKERFFDVLGWKENAVYRFYKNQISGGEFPITAQPWLLLKEGTLEWMPIARIEDKLLPYRNSLVIRQIHPKLTFAPFALTRDENAFLERITQTDPVNDVIGDAVERRLLEEEHATRLLFFMWQLQFLRMGEEQIGARTQRQLEELTLYINRLKRQSRLERLDLKGGATPAEIRKSYISLAKQYHPDHLPPGTHALVAKQMSEAFALIAEAYRVLSG